MEAREGISSGVTVIGAEAPSAYHVAPRSENNPSQNQPAGAPAVTAASPVSLGLAGTTGKKKRGRPRKYTPDGAVTMALSPMPISSSAPPGGDFSVTKRGKVRPSGLEYKQHKKVAVEHFGNGSFLLSFFLFLLSRVLVFGVICYHDNKMVVTKYFMIDMNDANYCFVFDECLYFVSAFDSRTAVYSRI